MRYYIATKLENHAAHNALRDDLNALGHEITYDWTHHGPVYGKGLETVREVALLETRGVLDADVVIVLWPGGRGTHVEMGMAIATGKPVVFVSPEEGHHEASKETCAFYHHPLVNRARTIGDAMPHIAWLANRRLLELHFRKWVRSGYCPDEAYNNPETAWARVLAWLETSDSDDRDALLDRGWPLIWELTLDEEQREARRK